MRPGTISIIAAMLCLVVLGADGSFLGAGTDRDSVRVLHAAYVILGGHYQRSRSLGFPLHEAATALFVAIGGPVAANFGSTLAALTGIAMAMRIARRVAPHRTVLATVTLCLSPLLLVNASVAIDFDWSFAAGMGLLLAGLRLAESIDFASPYLFGTAALVLLLIRPDNLLFILAVATALGWTKPACRLRVAAAVTAAVLIALAAYWGLNGASIFTGVSTTRGWSARLARAIVLGSAALGPGGALLLAGLAGSRQASGGAEALLRRTVWMCWLFYAPRFLALPDQVEYVILPVQLTILVAVCLLSARAALAGAGLAILPSWITLSFLARSPADGSLQFAVAPAWGAVAQDWAARRFYHDMDDPRVAAFVGSRMTGAQTPATLTYATYLPGFVSGRDLVIGQTHLYQVTGQVTGRAASTIVPRGISVIWSCNLPFGPGIGWRGWEAPIIEPEWPDSALRCQKVPR